MGSRLPPLKPGTPFEDLVVTSPGERKKSGRNMLQMSVCQCSCGRVTTVQNRHLKSGHTTSCGHAQNKAVTKHGMSRSREYGAWTAMIDRCCNENTESFKDYGGRGIAVCDEWKSSFENFLRDMGTRPSRNHSIDRFPDNNGSYCKENCRWATIREQSNNRRSNRMIEFYGKLLSLSDWSSISGVSQSTISSRLSKGVSEKESVWKPARKKKKASVA